VSYLRRRHPRSPALLFASDVVRERIAEAGVPLARAEEAEVVFVAHLDQIEVAELERAARAIKRGAPLFTGSYAPGYAGANGMIFSRGAMITAAIAKVTGTRPRVLGKPSRPAVAEISSRARGPQRRAGGDRRRPRDGHRARQAGGGADGPRAQRDQRSRRARRRACAAPA
jgi:ribonucleotide monophosphatase NagD (HAD superfamily)